MCRQGVVAAVHDSWLQVEGFLKEIIKSVVNNSFKSLEGWIHWRIQIRFDKNKPQERLDCGQSLIFLCQVTACLTQAR